MESRVGFCPSRKCHVTMVWDPPAPAGEAAAERIPDGACLDAGRGCRHPECPLFGVPASRMRERLREYRRESGPEPT